LPGRAPLPGKNPFEAAALGVAILHGPETGDFDESYASLDAAGGARLVSGAADLAKAVLTLWSDSEGLEEMIDAAAQVREAQQNALQVTLDVILSVLPAADQTPLSGGL
jgi:3-deoxy-D-manno-octulosonic-acid transferase